eukprot:5936941-Pyramimonas_sp.AAC.1
MDERPKRAQRASGGAQDGPSQERPKTTKMAQEAPEGVWSLEYPMTAQEGSELAQDGPRTTQDIPTESLRGPKGLPNDPKKLK